MTRSALGANSAPHPHVHCAPSSSLEDYLSAHDRLHLSYRLLSRKSSPLQSSNNEQLIFCTSLSSRYCHQDLHESPHPSTSRRAECSYASTSIYQSSLQHLGRHSWRHWRATSHVISKGNIHWFWRHPFLESPASAGELLHTPWRMPTFMATALLSIAANILSVV